MSICINILRVYNIKHLIFSVFSLMTFCDQNNFFKICEFEFLGTVSSLDQFVLKQVVWFKDILNLAASPSFTTS